MKYLAIILYAVLSVAGCCDHERRLDTSSLVITPGMGISNVLAVGMNRKDIASVVPDLSVISSPNVRMPWAENTGQRLPWQSPDRYEGRSAMLGARFHGDWDPSTPIDGFIEFYVRPPKEDPDFCFTGSLASGLIFGRNVRVHRDDVIQYFGDPMVSADPQVTNFLLYWSSGTSYSVTNSMQDGSTSELLYYPTNGIMFRLEGDEVVRVSVFRYVKAEFGP